MKILLLNCVYREGSTGKIVASLADTFRDKGHDVFVCYGLGLPNIDNHSLKVCSNMEHTVNAVISRISGIPYGGVFFSNFRIYKFIKRFHPDVVHIHCINASTVNVYSLLKFLARKQIKTVLTLHAEIFHTAGCEHTFDCDKWVNGCHNCSIYRERIHSWFFDRSRDSYRRMLDAVNSFQKNKLTVTAVSPWLAERAKRSAIMRNFNVIFVPNGVDTSIFHYSESQRIISRGQYQKVVLFVTPFFGVEDADIKGGRYLLVIAAEFPNYRFIVVASRMSKSLPSLPQNVQLWGRAKNQGELAQLYSEADVTLLLSRRETCSMVTVESLCCGTPVVGFKAGGPESIALPEYCRFVDYGNIASLVKALGESVKLVIDKAKVSREAVSAYAQSTMAELFLQLYRDK